MSSSNILDDIWQSYQATVDCFKIAGRSVKRKEHRLLSGTNYQSKPFEESDKLIDKIRSDADDYVILSLWAVFERKLLEYLQRLSKEISEKKGSDFNKKVQNKIENEIEYWKLNDILDLFKVVVDPELIGNAKQVKRYRDWIVHRNLKKGKPDIVSPIKAYEILSDIIERLEGHPELQDYRETA